MVRESMVGINWKEKVRAGLFGLCVGDALGVPVEFRPRAYLKEKPIIDMVGYGTYNQPPGTWSDDSSLTFCLAESLCCGYNLYDLADKCVQWYHKGYWTPYGEVFDIGNTTRMALERLCYELIRPDLAGMPDAGSNGNGSLMRVLPLAYWLLDMPIVNKLSIISEVSSITHRHPRSILACMVYVEFACGLLKGLTPYESYASMKAAVAQYDREYPLEELNYYERILDDITELSEADIQSSGYVVHTLEASIWCMLSSSSYEEAVLKAINLGEDTDTTGAVTGGLAGIYYGYEAIPREWINAIARKDDIEDLAFRFSSKLEQG
jgi:ADP-ribosyl-[dinitrogen reductase] hydrolase